jgi:hypothetical protein
MNVIELEEKICQHRKRRRLMHEEEEVVKIKQDVNVIEPNEIV